MFLTCEKNDTSFQDLQRCVSFGSKFPLFCWDYKVDFFLLRKVKDISKIRVEWFHLFHCHMKKKFQITGETTAEGEGGGGGTERLRPKLML